ncbi:FkbM family methyltransferase [Actinomadura sp. NPDC049382]|uniref:FkbM family methyltransferase n=1 Tax=Actinomadura sp. NPDC049382 TaxID=3158220 RepID=UPI00342754E3
MANVFHAFPALLDRLDVEPRALIHVGAHHGEELPFYQAAGFAQDQVTLVEPNPAAASLLRTSFPRARVVECACSDEPGDAVLHVMHRTNVSTLVTPDRRDRVTRTVRVKVRVLAEIQAETPAPPNVVVIDAQGLELAVLRGADLAAVDLVVVETCTVLDRTMASGYGDVSAFMADAGFVEADRWTRDLDWVSRWARGRRQRPTGGEIRDVVFAREAS